ncbi:MAG: peptidoglycan DD-metalloendopeptidase family protein [Bacillota bacterium]|nr:peptidoglycan DD-metalloendopeptidase family protein [Bacillota bacterium]
MYYRDEENTPFDRARETGKAAAKQAAKQALKRAVKAAVKAAGKLLVKGIAALIGAVGWPVIIVIIVLVALTLLFGAFYSAMPAQTALTGVEPSEQDAEVRQYAGKQVSEWNVKETWLVSGEGAWYPGKGEYTLGRLVDRYGRDAKLANQWGDAYAPVLYLAAQEAEDRMNDRKWAEERLKDAAENLRPWFYYKESHVTYCDKDGYCTTETVYLLVEAYTIRGHYRWKHKWVTKTYPDGGSVTYEEIADTQKLSDGLEYVEKHIVPLYKLPTETGEEKKQVRIAARATFEMAQGFTARQENLAWLEDRGSLVSFVSGASIPAEFRDALEEASQRTGIPVWLLAGLIERESSWDPNTVNEKTGCFGLTQLHPDYWPEWARRHGFDPEKDRWDPRAQIIVGAQVLAGFLGRPDWDWDEINLKSPPEELERALARYGGYGSDVEAAQGYITDIMRLAGAYRSRPGAWPVPGYYEISSHFGMRFHPILKKWTEHTGIDIEAPEGAPAVSVSGGVVFDAGYDETYGNRVYVRDAQHEYLYAHLSRIDVREGQAVRPGAKIGEVGSTGWSTGPHLHFGVRPIGGSWIDPEPLLRDLR